MPHMSTAPVHPLFTHRSPEKDLLLELIRYKR